MAAATADAAAEDGDDDDTTDGAADADDDALVVVDPGRDLAADGGACAAAVLAGAATVALRAVEEVLLQTEALVGTEFGRAAGDHAARRIAGVGVVALSVGPHNGLALLITRCTLARSTLQAVSTSCAIVGVLVGRTGGRVAGAYFLRVTIAVAFAADSALGSELTVAAAVLVGVIADCVVLELTSARVAAVVIATTFFAATIAVFIAFYDAVTTLLTGDGLDVFVVAQAVGLDTVLADGTANVSNTARGKILDTLPTGRVHDVLAASIASVCTEGTALR